jgi:ribose transport system ATP-binding protein
MSDASRLAAGEAQASGPAVGAVPEPAALAARNLSKTFGGARALDAVDFNVGFGEVHGLLGTNGSGKSTLIKILSGYHVPDPGGSLKLFTFPVPLPLPASEAKRYGLAFVHQHLGLIPTLSVLENLRMGDFATEQRWRIDWRAEARAAEASFARFGLAIDPHAEVSTLAPVERALLAIIRAFEDVQRTREDVGGGILVLDEPTPFLPKAGVEKLFSLVRSIVAAGSSVVFVSHDIDEVREITTRATILRDGKLAGMVDTKATERQDLVDLIIGRKVTAHKITRAPSKTEATASIRIDRLTGAGVDGVSIALKRGEIVGLAGLIGSGFNDVPYLISGATSATSGTITIDDSAPVPLADMNPSRAQGAGLALLPGDRLGSAGVGSLSITDNITLPVLPGFFGRLGLDWRAMTKSALALGAAHDVRPNRPGLPLEALSGGNQQKVLLAKWLQTAPKLFLLDEPTQGVDVGARQQIFAALDLAASHGTTILCASTDYEQLAQIASRVLIFARGRIVAELTGAAISKERIAEACYDTDPSATEEAA